MSDIEPTTANKTQSLNGPWLDLLTVLDRADQARAGNDAAGAFALYTRATELDSNSAMAWLGRAVTAPNLDDAITSWACAVALEPSDRAARQALEERVAEKEAATDAANIASLVELGKTIARVGEKAFAYRLFKRATELDDTNEEAWIWRAGLADDQKEMISALNHVLALNPDNTRAQAGLQWALGLKPPTETPSAAHEAAQLVEEGQRALDKGDKARAHELFVRATNLDQRNEHAWLWRGSTTAESDEALTCMEQALAINPDNESAREARAWLRVKKLRESAQANLPEAATIEEGGLSPRAGIGQRGKTEMLLLLAVLVFVLVLLLAMLVYRLA